MGSYADLKVNGYLLLTTRAFVYPEGMSVFTEADRYFSPAADQEHIAFFGYSAPARIVRDRLDVMGFTVDAARKDFEEAVADLIDDLSEDNDTNNSDVEFLKTLTFDRWLSAFRVLKENELQSWNLTDESHAILAADPEMFELMLDDDSEDPFGFRTSDFRYVLRAALAACEDTEIVDYDLADVLHAGYYSHDSKVAETARNHLISDFPANAPVVVLTEGSTDVTALRLAMSVRAPHLLDYYSFLDFAETSARGGAAVLVDVVKAFVGARIANRVIALFDNDTAAADALRALNNVPLPANIRVVRLPAIALAANYPTIGPAGPASADVNGRAGSLELYFGTDVLMGDAGALTPVHWRGYVDGVGQYQGELMYKRQLQTRFDEKARGALRDARSMESQDWSGVDAVLSTLRNAFE